MNGKHASQCNCLDCNGYREREAQREIVERMPNDESMPAIIWSSPSIEAVPRPGNASMTGRHPIECTCLDCIAFLEQELQCDIDEWMPDHDDIPQILCPSNTKELQCDVDELIQDHDGTPRIILSSPYIGRRIRKMFCGKWSTGIITAWDPDDRLYRAKYDDNDSEDLDHNKMHECLMCFEKHWSQKQRRTEMQRQRRHKHAEVPLPFM